MTTNHFRIRLARILCLGVLAVCWGSTGLAESGSSQAADGLPPWIDVFVARADNYHTYRIPSIAISEQGTLLAFCEGRKDSSVDETPTDIVLKRSVDGGRTWGSLQAFVADGGVAFMDPTPVVDRTTGMIWLFYDRYPKGKWSDVRSAGLGLNSITLWLTHSEDDGKTWSRAVNITKQIKKPEWKGLITGPGTGIQTRSGRLIVSGSHGTMGKGSCYLISSEDHGQTWKRSKLVGPNVNESQLVELADGSLLLNMRSALKSNSRQVATTKDGGATWSGPVNFPELQCPRCQASFIRYTLASQHGKNRLLFSNPVAPGKKDPQERLDMTVRLSYDEGKTWPVAKVIYPGPSQYSSLVILPDMTIGCIFERDYLHGIRFAHFSLEWLSDGKDRLSD